MEEEKVSKRQLILVGIAVLLTGILLIVKTSHSVFQVNKTINIMDAKVGNFGQHLPVLMSVSSSTTAFFEGKLGITKDKVMRINFTDTNVVPYDALGWADVSEAQDGSIMAWYKQDSVYPQFNNVWIGGNGGVAANPNSSYLFYYIENLLSMDLAFLNTSRVTDMTSMFQNTAYGGYIFDLDLSNFDVSKVENMTDMFHNTCFLCDTFNIIGLETWKTGNVENMSAMFYYAGRLSQHFTIGDISNWHVSSVTNMSTMFYGNAYLFPATATLNLSNWDITNVTDMTAMFMDTSFAVIRLDDWEVPTATKTNMFNMMNSLSSTNTKIYVQDSTMETWLKTGTSLAIPPNEIIIFP